MQTILVTLPLYYLYGKSLAAIADSFFFFYTTVKNGNLLSTPYTHSRDTHNLLY